MSSVSRFISGLSFTRIIRQTNSCSQVIDATNTKVIAHGGFPYEAYNGKACIRPWSVIRMVECSRAAAFGIPENSTESFIDAAKLYDTHLFFIVSTSTVILPELYDMSVKKSPLELNVALDFIGNTTFKLKTTISTENASVPLCVNHTQSVCVNKETRRPNPLPEWWKKKYSGIIGEPLKIPLLNSPPENGQFSDHSFQVLTSDVDPYMHMNWSNYIKHCYDAFVLSEFRKNPGSGIENLFRNVKQFSVNFIKEASFGDNIDIRFWQDADNSNLYCFRVFKKSDVICECSAEFFPL
jgi:acyl-CoA thioesterase FadM